MCCFQHKASIQFFNSIVRTCYMFEKVMYIWYKYNSCLILTVDYDTWKIAFKIIHPFENKHQVTFNTEKKYLSSDCQISKYTFLNICS